VTTSQSQDDLPPELKEQIVSLGSEAYEHMEAQRYSDARRLFLEVFGLLPEPRYEWAIGEPLLADAALAAILEGKPEVALTTLQDGLDAPVMNSPKINLRIGQAFFERGQQTEAGNHFLFALLGGGSAIFARG
jgi:hypothetical protein